MTVPVGTGGQETQSQVDDRSGVATGSPSPAPDWKRGPSRREVLRVLAVGALAGAAWSVGLGSRRRAVTRTRTLMGTTVHLTVVGGDLEAAAAAADATLARMASLEARLSRFRSDSEVSRLQASGFLEAPSRALLDVLQLADRVRRLGDGAFDVTVQPVLDLHRQTFRLGGGQPAPEAVERALERVDQTALRVEGSGIRLARPDLRITLDGIGKGYVVDRGIDVLRDRGFPNVFVEAGGDGVAAGEKGAGTPWRIGIRNPRSGLSLQARFDARDRAVATSGDYMQAFSTDRRHHHIVDPRTGWSAPELASSTVIAPDAATADALATLTMVLGSHRGRALLEDLPECEGYFVSKRLEVTRTSGFQLV